jgi:ABC-type uncharacterized transport system substrate-binding protein
MRRRQALFGIAGLGLGLSAARPSSAQPSTRPVVGLLDGGERLAWWAAFRQQLKEIGYIEGKNIVLEARYAKGKFAQLPALAQELIRLNTAVIVTASNAAALAASQATDKIPIVMATGSNHVSLGLVSSLARPGGNVTGLSSISDELTGKRLELLREILPRIGRLAVVWQSDNIGSSATMRDLQSLTRSLKITLQNVGVRKAGDLGEAFQNAARERAEAVFVVLSPLLYGERRRIADLALKHRLPNMSTVSEFVDAGGLISYGTSYSELFRRAALYVDKILKGAKPGDLPIEQPTKFETVVNLKTAKALGVTIPQAVLLRADRVID